MIRLSKPTWRSVAVFVIVALGLGGIIATILASLAMADLAPFLRRVHYYPLSARVMIDVGMFVREWGVELAAGAVVIALGLALGAMSKPRPSQKESA